MGLFDFLRKPQVATECRGPKLAAPRSVEPHKVGATETDIERQKNKQILELVEASVIRSGCFRPEKIPQLMLALRDPPTFAQLNTKASEASNGLLSKEEKQSLGLNTRRRYSREFIEYFEPDALKTIEPITMLSSIQSDAFHRTSRKFTLIRCLSPHIKEIYPHPIQGNESHQKDNDRDPRWMQNNPARP
jgi:hypothetical protein